MVHVIIRNTESIFIVLLQVCHKKLFGHFGNDAILGDTVTRNAADDTSPSEIRNILDCGKQN